MDLFFAIFQRILIKKPVFFEQGKIFDLVKVCFVFAFEKHAITMKIHSATIKNIKEEGKKYS